jgi:hypothetical protein
MEKENRQITNRAKSIYGNNMELLREKSASEMKIISACKDSRRYSNLNAKSLNNETRFFSYINQLPMKKYDQDQHNLYLDRNNHIDIKKAFQRMIENDRLKLLNSFNQKKIQQQHQQKRSHSNATNESMSSFRTSIKNLNQTNNKNTCNIINNNSIHVSRPFSVKIIAKDSLPPINKLKRLFDSSKSIDKLSNSNYSNKTSVNSLNSLFSNSSHSKTDMKQKNFKELGVKEKVYKTSNDDLSQNTYRTDFVNTYKNENMLFDEEKSYFSYEDKAEEGFYLDR